MKLLLIIMAILAFELGVGMFCGHLIQCRAARETDDPELESRRTLAHDS